MGDKKIKTGFNKAKFYRRLVLIIYDIISIIATSYLAVLVRYDFHITSVPEHFITPINEFLAINIVITILIFAAFRLYDSLWAFAGEMELQNLVVSCTISGVVNAIGLQFFKIEKQPVPQSYYFLYTFLLVIFIFVSRFSYRFLRTQKHKREKSQDVSSVMVIGAGEAANVIIKEIVNSLYLTMQVKCIIDDDPNKWGRYIQGVRVVGGRDKIKECADLFEIDQIILAIPSAPRKEISKILDICKETNCELKTLPGVYQLVNGDVNVSRLHNVEIEDLLGRDPVTVDIDSILGYVKGKVVCVTGGGGSIGSELCRQIAGHDPKQLIIIDIYENNAYDIQQELKKKYPELDLQVLIASVRNTNRVNWIFEHYRPQIVYHAAAHKHVPLMEDSPNEAIKNNVFGTFKTAMAAAQNGCEKFVMISTDKAVNPTNIMGASKRICEMIIQTFNRHYDTEFVAVRFGNVLGSNGSVIPLFKKQIAAGGPVTVTDPNIIRYFMTIPEAVSLVLQAGAYAKGGEIFVLDMGEPVRILDLAENLIKLSGFKVGEDIKIEFTGLRPGEKLYEEMLMDEEGLQDTANKMIHIGKPIDVDESRFFEDLEKLNHASKAESANIRNIVQEIVTTYHPNINDAEQHSAEHVRELQRVAAKINATD
ncbi:MULTISPECIES: polysaccharide biosynthesis protein [Butyrivibrio]|uniref:Polysaccharide biosynthesis protein n=1 Tax=Butyrivibrio fibrisolvens TaxID=831 RepID=A0A317FZK6_BUTFI|nr:MULTISPECIES: nucleoside-diphosphate sugar epimerase/dehydratase [Butyrivibrio]PWT26301.1 polysaccharide biosynthesis protein [Butyrivibrio fibrisolvens]SEP96838.1 NDP-sugar epimerase, includes UDP-GlcNAc-inverting 4,6-dehydratase FlaA1 and capsular polysaccharide biosynthesis protein EpsC [Butyrivibrio sp. TB]